MGLALQALAAVLKRQGWAAPPTASIVAAMQKLHEQKKAPAVPANTATRIDAVISIYHHQVVYDLMAKEDVPISAACGDGGAPDLVARRPPTECGVPANPRKQVEVQTISANGSSEPTLGRPVTAFLIIGGP